MKQGTLGYGILREGTFVAVFFVFNHDIPRVEALVKDTSDLECQRVDESLGPLLVYPVNGAPSLEEVELFRPTE